jgi:hypothetical protein
MALVAGDYVEQQSLTQPNMYRRFQWLKKKYIYFWIGKACKNVFEKAFTIFLAIFLNIQKMDLLGYNIFPWNRSFWYSFENQEFMLISKL